MWYNITETGNVRAYLLISEISPTTIKLSIWKSQKVMRSNLLNAQIQLRSKLYGLSNPLVYTPGYSCSDELWKDKQGSVGLSSIALPKHTRLWYPVRKFTHPIEAG